MLISMWQLQDARYAYLLRQNLDEPGLFDFKALVVVSGFDGYCPLLGVLRVLEEMVGDHMDDLLDQQRSGYE